MVYWLCITTEENWKVIKQRNIWGVAERHSNTIAKVKPKDKCLIYVLSTKKNKEIIPPRIVAAYEVVSEVFEILRGYSSLNRTKTRVTRLESG